MEERITIAEASKRFAVSSSAIRRLIEAGRVSSKRDVDGRHLVLVGELTGELARRVSARRSGALAGKPSSELSDEPSGELVAATERYVRSLETALEHERRVSGDLRTQNRELQIQLVKLAAEMQATLARDTDGKLSRWFRR
jgi:predicted ABC-type transport system involved in lysophospholipase L1 biosynthesis ATPase subunit